MVHSAGCSVADTLRLRRISSINFGAGVSRISFVSQPISDDSACSAAADRISAATALSTSTISPGEPSLLSSSMHGGCVGSRRQRDRRSKSFSYWYAMATIPNAATAVRAAVSASRLKPLNRRRRSAAREITVVCCAFDIVTPPALCIYRREYVAMIDF